MAGENIPRGKPRVQTQTHREHNHYIGIETRTVTLLGRCSFHIPDVTAALHKRGPIVVPYLVVSRVLNAITRSTAADATCRPVPPDRVQCRSAATVMR